MIFNINSLVPACFDFFMQGWKWGRGAVNRQILPPCKHSGQGFPRKYFYLEAAGGQ